MLFILTQLNGIRALIGHPTVAAYIIMREGLSGQIQAHTALFARIKLNPGKLFELPDRTGHRGLLRSYINLRHGSGSAFPGVTHKERDLPALPRRHDLQVFIAEGGITQPVAERIERHSAEMLNGPVSHKYSLAVVAVRTLGKTGAVDLFGNKIILQVGF